MQERSSSPHLDKGHVCERSRDMHEELIMCTQAANNKDPTPELQVSSSNGLLHVEEDIRMLAAGDQGFSATEVQVDENLVRSQMEQSTKLKKKTIFPWTHVREEKDSNSRVMGIDVDDQAV
jgi:hypothetical protein